MRDILRAGQPREDDLNDKLHRRERFALGHFATDGY